MEHVEDVKTCNESAVDTNEDQLKDAKVTIKDSLLCYFTANRKPMKIMELY